MAMIRALLESALRFLRSFHHVVAPPPPPDPPAAPAIPYRRLERVVLTDQVARTLFDDFAAHKRGRRGAEEIGWVLLGLREENQALALATLPAGTQRSAGVAHVRFNSQAQALASRIVRQADKRLVILGVVHTHPGSLRHPSEGDYHGDSQWVGRLRGGEGIFGIGTADVDVAERHGWLDQPAPHRQVLGNLLFSWYALAEGDRRYRPLPVQVTLGPDLARPLHPVWEVLEQHAEELDHLSRQQAGASFEVLNGAHGKTLVFSCPLAEPGSSLKILLDGREARYVMDQQGRLASVDPAEQRLDRAVYLILAELCGQRGRKGRERREAARTVG